MSGMMTPAPQVMLSAGTEAILLHTAMAQIMVMINNVTMMGFYFIL